MIRITKSTSTFSRIYDKNGFGFIISSNPNLIEIPFVRTETKIVLFNRFSFVLIEKIKSLEP